MKGPGLRNDLEIRRTFLCPKCGRKVMKLGDVVSQICTCSEPPVWMQIQPPVKRPPYKFEKIEIPLTEEDLVIRERPRRMPEPPPEGAPETDRRNLRPKRPKPERRSFESFQEDLAAKVQAESGHVPKDVAEAIEIVELVVIESIVRETTIPIPSKVSEVIPPTPPADEFGAGL